MLLPDVLLAFHIMSKQKLVALQCGYAVADLACQGVVDTGLVRIVTLTCEVAYGAIGRVVLGELEVLVGHGKA